MTNPSKNLATCSSVYQGGSSVSFILNLEPIIFSTSLCVNKSCSINSLNIPTIALYKHKRNMTTKIALYDKRER